MLIIIIFAAVLLLLLLVNLKFRFLKGMLLASVVICTLVFTVSGSFLGYRAYQEDLVQKENLYMTLCYTRDGMAEAARAKLENVPLSSNYRFVADAIRILINRQEGYDSTAELNLVILSSNYRQDADRGTITSYLQSKEKISQTELTTVLSLLEKELNLSKSNAELFSGRYLIESSIYSRGSMGISPERLVEQYGSNEGSRLLAQYYLGTGNGRQAITQAVELVDAKPSMDNRVMLAEAVAQLSYERQDLSHAFLPEDEATYNENSLKTIKAEEIAERYGLRPANIRDKEVQKLLTSFEKEQEALALLESRLTVEADPGRKEPIRADYEKKALEVQELKSKIEYIYVYRAMNSVSGLGGIQGDSMRVKLYFAVGEGEKAKEVLAGMTRTGKYPLLDEATQDSLDTLRNAMEGGNGERLSGEQAAELTAALRRVLSGGGADILSTMGDGLVSDLCVSVVADIKYRQQGLTAVAVDTREYPKITAKVSASKDVMQLITGGDYRITLKDTHTSPQYTITVEDSQIDTCFVVDESGSMGGAVQDVQRALRESLKSTGFNSNVAIVGYENSARIICEMTSDYVKATAATEGIHSNGGTNIQSGLALGVDQLRDTYGVRNIILMTDGQDNMSDAMSQTLAEARSIGITVYTIGFGDVNDTLLTEIAALTGGKYVKADSSQELGGVYDLIQGYISNLFTIEYTVENTGLTERYLFVSTTDGKSTDRMLYTIDTGITPEAKAEVTSISPSMLSPGTQRNRSVRLSGSNLDLVTAVSVDGASRPITNQGSEGLNISLPEEMEAGIYEITVVYDGGERVISSAFIVGEFLSVRQFAIGNLLIRGQAIQLDSQTLAVGNGITINDVYQCDGLLLLETAQDFDPDSAENGVLELGDSGAIGGDLPLYIYPRDYANSIDPGYYPNVNALYLALDDFGISVTEKQSDIDWADSGKEGS